MTRLIGPAKINIEDIKPLESSEHEMFMMACYLNIKPIEVNIWSCLRRSGFVTCCTDNLNSKGLTPDQEILVI